MEAIISTFISTDFCFFHLRHSYAQNFKNLPGFTKQTKIVSIFTSYVATKIKNLVCTSICSRFIKTSSSGTELITEMPMPPSRRICTSSAEGSLVVPRLLTVGWRRPPFCSTSIQSLFESTSGCHRNSKKIISALINML